MRKTAKEGFHMGKITEITTFEDPALDVYARLTEAQLMNRFDPSNAMFIAESPKVIHRALDAGYQPVSLLMERKDIDGSAADVIARCGDIPVYTGDRELLERITGYKLTRGVLCAMRRFPLKSVEETVGNARRIVILENVMNPTNVGAIFRSAAALGMDAVLLTPGCSDPLYRRSARVSMGTVFQVPWTFIGSEATQWPDPGMSRLQQMGYKTAALALRDDSFSIDDPLLAKEEKLAVLLGSEGDGLTNQTIAHCDYTVKIPMYHGVDSLNVAAASAVAFWELRAR
jgi:tRNA G18 (ribose-2'-O)-methylase SpoU